MVTVASLPKVGGGGGFKGDEGVKGQKAYNLTGRSRVDDRRVGGRAAERWHTVRSPGEAQVLEDGE